MKFISNISNIDDYYSINIENVDLSNVESHVIIGYNEDEDDNNKD